MSQFKIVLLSSVDALRAQATAWNVLWQRSSVDPPTAQAEPLAVWLEAFCEPTSLRAFTVFDGPRMVASLPLIERRLGGCVRQAACPSTNMAKAANWRSIPGSMPKPLSARWSTRFANSV